jgi:hypothetical protein
MVVSALSQEARRCGPVRALFPVAGGAAADAPAADAVSDAPDGADSAADAGSAADAVADRQIASAVVMGLAEPGQAVAVLSREGGTPIVTFKVSPAA